MLPCGGHGIGLGVGRQAAGRGATRPCLSASGGGDDHEVGYIDEEHDEAIAAAECPAADGGGEEDHPEDQQNHRVDAPDDDREDHLWVACDFGWVFGGVLRGGGSCGGGGGLCGRDFFD